MKALSFSALGDSDVLQYIDIPNPISKNEILVEIRAL
jgi:NADPH2:quinone reductase